MKWHLRPINQQLPLPAEIVLQTLKEPKYAKHILDKSGEINKKLGQKKAHLSTTKTAKKKNKDEIASILKELISQENTDNELVL